MASDPQVAYEFAQFTLLPTEKRLLCEGKAVPLAPKVFDTLVLLVENQGRLIQKEELLKTLWPNSVVEEVALAHNVSQLRKALGDPVENPRFIETVPKRGYRVLPLENLSGDKEQEYFAEGITDALTTELAQIGSLRVISRTSATQFKGSRESLPQIGRDLKVDALVEGTVARAQGRVRVTAQLIAASSDHHLWARTYERDVKDVLALQDEVARDIAAEIRIKLTSKERGLLTQVHAVDPEAHDAYLRGRYWWSKRDAEGEWKGLEYFQQAIAKDPNYALAYAGVADSYIMLGHHGGLTPKEALPKARQAAHKALELDPSLAEAHASLAIVKLSSDWDWPGAESEFKQAIALNPNYATAHHWYSHHLLAMGRFDEAVSELDRARDLDPYSIPINNFLGITLYSARRYDDALRQFRRGLEMHPDRVEFYDGIADVYEQRKMFAEAFAWRRRLLSVSKEPQMAQLEEAYQRSGYRGYLSKRIDLLEQGGKFEDLFTGLLVAHMYALLGDEGHVMSYLERAYDERNPWILYLQVDPVMDPLRTSPRFRDLIRRIGLPPLSN
jgi:TolB-like protein/lipoprotein NlpI